MHPRRYQDEPWRLREEAWWECPFRHRGTAADIGLRQLIAAAPFREGMPSELEGSTLREAFAAQFGGAPNLRLEATVRWTANHGGQFVLAAGLTLADQQRDFFFGILREQFPDLLPLYERLYPPGSYGPVRSGNPHAIGRRVRDLCAQYGISDRMPRPIIPGDKRALNKRIVEALANECYRMELENAPVQRAWAYRKAAWAIEDLDVDIGLLYRQMGRKGLESIENVGPRLAEVIEGLLAELSVSPEGCERPSRRG